MSSNITKLMDEIITKKYKLGKYKEFLIYEPKERVIEALPFRDRVVIKCFCDVALKNKIDRKARVLGCDSGGRAFLRFPAVSKNLHDFCRGSNIVPIHAPIHSLRTH